MEAAGPRVALRQERSQVEEVLEGGRDTRVFPPAMVRSFENDRKLTAVKSRKFSISLTATCWSALPAPESRSPS